MLFWLTVFGLSMSYIFNHGIEYVAWPLLNPPTDTIYYDGPGARTPEHGRGKSFMRFMRVPLPWWVKQKLHRAGFGGGSSRRVPVPVLGKLDEIEMGKKRRVD
jgi:phosphatidylinositol 4-phosphatase